MGLEVYWLQLAEEKLEEIFNYHKAKASKKIAQNLVYGIVDATKHLEQHPKMGQIEFNLSHRKKEFRYLVFRNYKIIYWLNFEKNKVEIANIFDTRQNPIKYWKLSKLRNYQP